MIYKHSFDAGTLMQLKHMHEASPDSLFQVVVVLGSLSTDE